MRGRQFSDARMEGSAVGQERRGRASSGVSRYAGDHPSPQAKAMINEALAANKRNRSFTAQGGGQTGNAAAQSGGEVASSRAAANEGRRLPNERGWYSPEAKIEGGPGVSAKNPWS
jgi:hypothetical protein